MCGIAGIHIKPSYRGKVPVGKLLNGLLLGIEYRGMDATGFLSIGFDGDIVVDKDPIPASKMVKLRKKLKGTPRTVLAHTRLATQGSPDINNNNHPVQWGPMFAVHNGHISNDHEMFTKTLGMPRNAQVDSEAIPAALYKSGLTIEGAKVALGQLEGAMAVAAVDVRLPSRLLLAKGWSSPLVMVETKWGFVWASSAEAIREAWGKALGTPPSYARIRELKMGEALMIEDGKATEFTFEPCFYDYFSSRPWEDYTRSGTSYGSTPKKSNVVRYLGEGATNEGRGYYIENADGSREWRALGGQVPLTPVDDEREGFWAANAASGGDDEDPTLPSLDDYEIAMSMESWAVQDLPMSDDALFDLADETGLDKNLIEWLLFHCEPDVIDTEPALERVVGHLQKRWRQLYDVRWDKVSEPATVSAEDVVEVLDGLTDEEELQEREVGHSRPVLIDLLENATSEQEVEELLRATTPRSRLDGMGRCIYCTASTDGCQYCADPATTVQEGEVVTA